LTANRTGRRALSIALTTALAGATLFTLQGTSSAAPSATGTGSLTEGKLTAGNVLAVTGSGFKDAAGVVLVKTVGAGLPRVVAGASCTDALTAAAGAGAAFTYSVASATRITLTLPAHAAGAVKICLPVVAAGAHVANSYVAVGYTYAAQPVLGTVSEVAGPSYGGQNVVVTASPAWRAGSTTVLVGGVSATNVKVAAGGASLSFTTPAGAGTARDITVKTPGFANVTSTGAYDYENALKVSPQIIDPTNGDTVTVTGAGFSALTQAGVWINDGATNPLCGNIAVVSDTEITCDVAAHARGIATVVVGEDVDGTLANATSKTVVTGGTTITFSTY
jgi:hypothetical protein